MATRRLQRFVQGRSLCVVLACMLALSSVGVCLTFPIQSAYADAGVLSVGHKIEYGSWDTNAFSVNGFEAYCGDPSATTPPAGTYEMRPLTNASVAAGLWYGYGGPGFDALLWPQNCPIGNGDDAYRMMTHVALAYLATNDTSFAYGKCDEGFRDWCDGALFGSGSICERILDSGFTLDGASESATALPQGFTAYVMETGADTQIIYTMNYHPLGNFDLHKTSARPALSDGNACYSLAGARYGIFGDEACTRSVGSIVTDDAGRGHSPDLEPGTYYIKELAPPTGYALSSIVTRVNVGSGPSGTVRVQDEPQSQPIDIVLRKLDAETGEARPLGGAELGSAEYTVRFYAGQFATAEEAASSRAPLRSWVLRTNAAGELRLNDEAKASGDDFYTDAQGNIVLPLGTVIIEETAAPTGYLRDENVLLANVTSSGTATSVDAYPDLTHPEQVIRGDLSFVKARESDQRRLAGIPFRLTSNTTGESHIIVTDENGEARTASSWNLHSTKTNGNDAAVSEDGTVDETLLDEDAGVWFGTDEPVDDKGALPFDTYTVSELRVAANADIELITIPALTIKRDDYEVNWGTLDDQPTAAASLRTHARDATDGDKTVEAHRDATVMDEVRYAGVAPGKEYRIAGHLVQRSNSAVVTDEAGTPIGSEATFLAEAAEGSVALTFAFDASEYADTDLVVLEKLTDLETGEVVAAESNLDDSDQTVHIAANAPATPASDEPDEERPFVHAASAPEETSSLVQGELSRTGDALFLLICCCIIGSIVALLGIIRARRMSRRKQLRARVRAKL